MNIPFIDKEFLLQHLSISDLIQLIEQSLEYPKDKCFVPNRFQSTFHDQTFLSMPSFTQECTCCKLLTVTPSNGEKQLPSLYGMVVVFDKEIGKPLCIIDASMLTALRTGAIGGYAISLLSKENVSTIGLIGCGVQGYYQLLYALVIRPITKVYLFTSPSKDLTSFIELLQNDLGKQNIKREIQFIVCKNSTEVVQESEIIITATTSSVPVLPDDPSLYKQKLIIAIGSYQPTSRELPDAVFSYNPPVFIETDYALEESGDLAIPLSSGKLSVSSIHLLTEIKSNPSLKQSTMIFKSVGIALYDNLIGYHFYQKYLSFLQ